MAPARLAAVAALAALAGCGRETPPLAIGDSFFDGVDDALMVVVHPQGREAVTVRAHSRIGHDPQQMQYLATATLVCVIDGPEVGDHCFRARATRRDGHVVVTYRLSDVGKALADEGSIVLGEDAPTRER